MRPYAAVPHEYLEEMELLTDEEWGRLIRALVRYSKTGEETELPGREQFYWRRVVNRERGLQEHYAQVAEKRRAAAQKGNASRWGIANDRKCEEDNVKVKVEDQVKAKDKVHSPPSKDGRRGGAAGAAERMRRDMEELERMEECGLIGRRDYGAPGETRRSGFVGERRSTGMSEFSPQAETRDMEVATT